MDFDFTRGLCPQPQDLRPLPDPKKIGPGPMPLFFVPCILLLHTAVFCCITWAAVNFFTQRSAHAAYTALLADKGRADASSQQVERDIKANNEARAFYTQQEEVLDEAVAVAPAWPAILKASPPGKLLRIALRRGESFKENGEFFLRYELLKEDGIAKDALAASQESLDGAGLQPTNFASHSDQVKSYVEGRVHLRRLRAADPQ